MSIRNLKDGSKKPWLCECYPQGRGGKRVRKKFATKGEAKSFELFTMKEIDDKPWLGKKTDHRRLQDLLDTWWQVHGHTVKTGKVSYDVMEKTIRMLGNPLARLFTANDYLHYRANRVSHHPTRPDIVISATTHNIELKTLRAMFNKLIKYERWDMPNPLADIELVASSQRELAYLTKEQITPFLERVRCDNSPSAGQICVACKVCLATGARIGEALKLKCSQVSQYKLLFTETKGKKNRSVPISRALYRELLDVAVSESAVFDVTYYAAWECVKRALPEHVPSGQATHILRHTFASHFMMNGGDILVLQRILGHSKIEQTMAYAHFSPDHLMQAVELNPLENESLKSGDKMATTVN
ncbi:tyrosine-type recombinase/integrase [Vibrio neptunius]|uniref:phage integrase n=1 Tax=Vibrio neptunius TaxID=170651 RepID=UPI001C5CB743|nr:tyrosine-type recombinase/integrase [Vibrio neptunius]QXX09218.1 tyrosine-type recombinase/integrase [Vibrio neptunius]